MDNKNWNAEDMAENLELAGMETAAETLPTEGTDAVVGELSAQEAETMPEFLPESTNAASEGSSAQPEEPVAPGSAGQQAGDGKNRKDKKTKKTKAGKKKKHKTMLFGIRNKIILCFLVPIVFMAVIGVVSYVKAQEGMSEKFRESSIQTMNMATDYIDMSCGFIAADGIEYASDPELIQLMMGLYKTNQASELKVTSNTKTSINAAQTSNDFIGNIHIIPKKGTNIISTATKATADGMLDEYLSDLGVERKDLAKWGDVHTALDEHLGITSDSYILTCQTMSSSNNYCVVVDVDRNNIGKFIRTLDFGDGSIVGFITDGGREIIYENLAEGESGRLSADENAGVFYGQDFYTEIVNGSEKKGTSNVHYMGQDYFFLYSKSAVTNATICALVPNSVVVGQAEEIRTITIGLIILATIIVLIIGILIVAGIQNNMNRISNKLEEVAQGDLTVQVKAKGRDEFRYLASSATNMIENTKNLVNKVSDATSQLSVSAEEVGQVSVVVDEYSRNITEAISDINEGMTRQSAHAQECVAKTDILSNEIQNVSRVVEDVEKLVNKTNGMITQGIEIIQLLGSRAEETTQITAKVGESIETLRQDSEIINTFVATISDITEQTNLLSLNASIEAARSGEAGRGFAVVAEEIRKLADDSAVAAGQISMNVEHIAAQTMNSVESANQARAMVALQSEAVTQVVDVFHQMGDYMQQLVAGLRTIVEGIEKADRERGDTMLAVKSISEIIEQTAANTETVSDVAEKLLANVEKLNSTAQTLDENMGDLKSEVSVFRI